MRHRDPFRDAMARWASTVTVCAVRNADDGRVHATTVTSFAPVSADPPQVVVSLNANAQALPFVRVGGHVGISLLGEDQRRMARVFADPFPVGPPPWPESGVPVLDGAVATLVCRVTDVHEVRGGTRLVVAEAEHVGLGDGERPLLYWRRSYGVLGEG